MIIYTLRSSFGEDLWITSTIIERIDYQLTRANEARES